MELTLASTFQLIKELSILSPSSRLWSEIPTENVWKLIWDFSLPLEIDCLCNLEDYVTSTTKSRNPILSKLAKLRYIMVAVMVAHGWAAGGVGCWRSHWSPGVLIQLAHIVNLIWKPDRPELSWITSNKSCEHNKRRSEQHHFGSRLFAARWRLHRNSLGNDKEGS